MFFIGDGKIFFFDVVFGVFLYFIGIIRILFFRELFKDLWFCFNKFCSVNFFGWLVFFGRRVDLFFEKVCDWWCLEWGGFFGKDFNFMRCVINFGGLVFVLLLEVILWFFLSEEVLVVGEVFWCFLFFVFVLWLFWKFVDFFSDFFGCFVY